MCVCVWPFCIIVVHFVAFDAIIIIIIKILLLCIVAIIRYIVSSKRTHTNCETDNLYRYKCYITTTWVN